MITVRPFKALRPLPEKAAAVASPPYDVLDSDEARIQAKDNPISFLHVVKSEIDLPPEMDIHTDVVYKQGAKNLQAMIASGVLIQEDIPCFYIYHMKMGAHEQTGLVAETSAQEYIENKIKKHEFTKPAKESDRAHHIQCLNAHTGPIIMMYHVRHEIDELIQNAIKNASPLYDIKGDYDIQHIIYRISDKDFIEQIQQLFQTVEALYIADGHHRTAAATSVMRHNRNINPHHTGEEPYNFFLSVIFPDNQMKILDYNRVVRDLNSHTVQTFLDLVSKSFEVTPYLTSGHQKSYQPEEEHTFGMYLEGKWYQLKAKSEITRTQDPVEILDVSILQNHLLSPILGIGDPRSDERIHFVGGIRGLQELEHLVDSGQYRIAFSLYPTQIDQIMAVADADKVMPPKSTWFEPKLRSGLIIHTMD